MILTIRSAKGLSGGVFRSSIAKSFRAVWLTFILLLMGANSVVAEAASPSIAREWLKKCLESQSVTDRVSMRVTMDAQYTAHDSIHGDHEVEAWFRRDGDRIDVSGEFAFSDESSHSETRNRFHYLVNADLKMSYQSETDNGAKPQGALASSDRTAGLSRYLKTYDFGAGLDGYVWGEDCTRLASLMLESGDLKVLEEEMIGGVACKVVESTTPYGKITMWLAAEEGFIPHKVVYEKGPSDIFHGAKKASQQPLNKRFHGDQLLVGWSVVIDNVRVLPIGDAYIPVGGRLTETHRLSKGHNTVSVFTYERSEIELDPDFDEATTFVAHDLPDGTRVTNADDADSGVAYVWSDGKVVQGFTDFDGGLVSEGSLGSRSGMLRVVLLAFNALLLACLIGVWVVRRGAA